MGDTHPFYGLSRFTLPFLEPLKVPQYLYLSRNYFNPNWKGLRRIKNVVMVLEWAPNATQLRLLTEQERQASLPGMTDKQRDVLAKAFSFLRYHGHSKWQAAREGGKQVADAYQLAVTDVANAIQAAVDREIPPAQLALLMNKYGNESGQAMGLDGLQSLLLSGDLTPEQQGRCFVAVSLAEAETLRRILHLRPTQPPVARHPCTQFALRYSPMARLKMPGSSSGPGQVNKPMLLGDGGGVVMDASAEWRASSILADPSFASTNWTGAPAHQLDTAYNVFRFFDSDMHFSEPALNSLLRALQRNSPYQRERFFSATGAGRRRLARKWQDTPLAKVLIVEDEWASLRQRGLAVWMREAIAATGLTHFEAFTTFDADNSQSLCAPELYGAMRFLHVPDVSAEDVVTLLESADRNADGVVDYKEWTDLLTTGSGMPATEADDEDGEDEAEETRAGDGKTQRASLPPKVEPYGADELRGVQIRRKKEEFALQRQERARRTAYETALDMKLFQEELRACANRPGGANPLVCTSYFGQGSSSARQVPSVIFRFTDKQVPLRLNAKGLLSFPKLHAARFADAKKGKTNPLTCSKGHAMVPFQAPYMMCNMCNQNGVAHRCTESSGSFGVVRCRFYVCLACFERHQDREQNKRTRFLDGSRFLRCAKLTSFSIQFPVLKAGDETAGASAVPMASSSSSLDLSPGATTLERCTRYTLTLETQVLALPPSGQLSALLRFHSPEASRSRTRHQASLYLDADGRVGAQSTLQRLASSSSSRLPKSQLSPPGARLKAKTWSVITVVVNADTGKMKTYVNGELSVRATDLPSADLVLSHQLVVFGGGKRAESRGGDLRRLILDRTELTATEVQERYVLGKASLRGPLVVLLVDNQAVSTGANELLPPLHQLQPGLQSQFESWAETNPHTRMTVKLLQSQEAAPRTVQEACRSYVTDGVLDAVIINLQNNVWSAGLSVLEQVEKERAGQVLEKGTKGDKKRAMPPPTTHPISSGEFDVGALSPTLVPIVSGGASTAAAPVAFLPSPSVATAKVANVVDPAKHTTTPNVVVSSPGSTSRAFKTVLYCQRNLTDEQLFQLKTHDWDSLSRVHSLQELCHLFKHKQSTPDLTQSTT
eukprot:gb/GEZN01000666.1/.p1 GENE.gb/GEZN01000666.1/~~gb/GEZN01000666.1/.p1  ORF type:complete len:1255 (+),score=253.94 gb/GEZN01000666.1/:412-3765(+)